MTDLPRPLVRKVAAGQAVLFLGAHIPGIIDEGGFPGPAELACALAECCDYPEPDRSLARVAQYFQVTRSRDDLIAFLKAQLDDPAHALTPFHYLVACLPLPVIITTSYDTLLESALLKAQRPFAVVTGDQDLAYVDESKTLLIKMLGSIERGETLVITEDDYLDFTRRLPALSSLLKAYFATRTLLFLCHDLADAAFKQLYAEVTANLGQHVRRAYAVLPGRTDYQAQYWSGKGLQVIDADPLAFLEALSAAVPQEPPPPTTPPPLGRGPGGRLTKRPFKFLDYYDSADADIFFGRERETRALAQLALSHRLVILTGASGTGKTSLVRAGAVPALKEQGCLAVVTRLGDDPKAAIINALRRAVPDLQLPATATLAQAVQAAEAQSKTLIVIFLDQFEEFFLRLGQPTRERFIAALAKCLDDANLGTRFVLSLRSDFFVQLQAFRSRLPGVFHNTYEVYRLTPQQARETIVGPLRAVGLDVEPTLVDAIVADLDLEGIDPPQLQIVCDRLYQKAMDTGDRRLTVALYERLGRAERILNEYLDDVLARLPDADRALAREVLKALVTSRDTKDNLSLEQLVRGLAAPEADVARVVGDLEGDRLLRRVDAERAGELRYELVHDHLARRVREWLDEGERKLKAVQEMLRRQVDGWRQDRLSLSRAEMRLVDGQRDRLRPSEEELALIAYSAALHDVSAEAWLDRAPDATKVLRHLLGDEDAEGRQRAAARLGQRGGPGVGEALAKVALGDPEPAVREVAAQALGSLSDESGLNALAQATRDHESRRLAVVALAHTRDVGARLPTSLSTVVRLRVMGRVAGMRFWRARLRVLYQTLGGALGGALGSGLGFAILSLFKISTVSQLQTLPFVVVLFGVPGLVAGGLLGLLAAVGAALSPRRERMLYLVGAASGGALGYGLVFLLFGLIWFRQDPQLVFQAPLAGLLLGAMVGVGVALPAWLTRRGVSRDVASIGGGLLGGMLAGLIVDLTGLMNLAGPVVATVVGAVIGGGVGLGLALVAGVWLRRREGWSDERQGGEVQRWATEVLELDY